MPFIWPKRVSAIFVGSRQYGLTILNKNAAVQLETQFLPVDEIMLLLSQADHSMCSWLIIADTRQTKSTRVINEAPKLQINNKYLNKVE